MNTACCADDYLPAARANSWLGGWQAMLQYGARERRKTLCYATL